MPTCPFCGAAESDRITVEGRRFLVFACMFTPEVDPKLGEAELESYLQRSFTREGANAYFRGMCDRMHFFLTKGEGAPAPGPTPPEDAA
jgi:hypothetical protein